MKIKTEDFLQALRYAKPGLASKEWIEQSTHFAFLDGSVVTYNDEISVQAPIEGLSKIHGAVDFKELFPLVGKLTNEEMSISQDDATLKITAGRVKAGFTLHQEVKLPLDHIGEFGKEHRVQRDLFKALAFVAPAAGKNVSRHVLTSVHVDGTNGIVEATDSIRAVQHHLKRFPNDFSFLLSSTACSILPQYTPSRISLGNSDSWVRFETKEGPILYIRTGDDEFPDTSKIMDIEGEEFTFPETIMDVLDRASIFSSNPDDRLLETVQVDMASKKMIIRAHSEKAWFEETVKADYGGEDASFFVHPVYLREAVSEQATGVLGKDRLKFSTENWSHVIALKA